MKITTLQNIVFVVMLLAMALLVLHSDKIAKLNLLGMKY